MNTRTNFKAIRLTAFIFTVLFSAEVAGLPLYLPLASAQAESGARQGLPIEMLISPEELRQKQLKGESFLLLDARSPKHYNGGHIEGAILSPKADQELAEMLSRYPKSTPIVAYCMVHCQASAALVMKLKRLGFSDLRDMEEGIEVWQQKGYPIAQ